METRRLVEDPRWPAYQERLVAYRKKAEDALLKRSTDFPTMRRLAGEISAIDYALGVPAELLELEPRNLDTP